MYHIEMLWTHSKHTWFRLNQARSSAAPFHSRGWSCEAPNPQCRSIPQQRLAMWSPPVNTNYSVLRLHCGGTFAYTYGKTRRPSGMLGPWKVQDKTPFAASVLRFWRVVMLLMKPRPPEWSPGGPAGVDSIRL